MKMNTWLWAVGVMGLMGCGTTVAGVTGKQADAVNAAANETCDSYARCNEIGAGKKYATRAECDADNQSFWNNRWPAADCDGKINGTSLETCTNAIKGTACDSFIDQINTAYNKCAKSDVCKGKE